MYSTAATVCVYSIGEKIEFTNIKMWGEKSGIPWR